MVVFIEQEFIFLDKILSYVVFMLYLINYEYGFIDTSHFNGILGLLYFPNRSVFSFFSLLSCSLDYTFVFDQQIQSFVQK